ncbi:MopE-related protein [Bradymonas sediminis]|uniref:MopE-related protein n=1 Tax=Bradymonas sediminis TaxID=1548548 RepID=UPI0010E9696B|nr:MopE-related protein [Bradymonas sediminis]TDP76509.1 putative metal-binding protein [Bradymonas sediminis]
MKLFSTRKSLVILAVLFAGFSGVNCSDNAALTAGNAQQNPSNNDAGAADTTGADTNEDLDTTSPDTSAPDTTSPDTSAPDTTSTDECTSFDLSGCDAPANSSAVGCTVGSCTYECNAGFHDLNQDLGQATSDGCEYACTPTNGGVEICDGLDNNCDGEVDGGLDGTYYKDADGDGFGDDSDSVQGCDAANNYTTQTGGDCNDLNASVYPDAPIMECASPIDYNCNGSASCDDPGCMGEICRADGRAVCTSGPIKCIAEDTGGPVGICEITNGGVEICDGIDNDCNGAVDDGLSGETYYKDIDGDGYGQSADSVQGCDAAAYYTATEGGDCNDTMPGIYPGQGCDEVPGDIEPVCFPSNGGVEICDGRDNDCNGEIDDGITGMHYKDADGDGYPDISDYMSSCNAALGYTHKVSGTLQPDCDDNNPDIYPGAPPQECASGTDYSCNNRGGCRDAACHGQSCNDSGGSCNASLGVCL